MKKIALVTGGSRGIGAATCRVLSNAGYHVIVHYSHSAEKAQKLAEEISGEIIQANFELDEDIRNMADSIIKKHGQIDALVNNAGIADCESLNELTRDSFLKTLQVNLWSHALLTKLLSPIIKNGSIVFTSSVCAQLPTADALAYAASKAGIEAIVRSITAGFAPNVRVNAVAPTCTDTDMMKKNYTDEDVAWVKDTFPMRRPCDPEDIAEMIGFLISDKSKNITGQILTVDAGASAR
jgi:3-oxoacyl-[acyl-carrier protein] reductase